MTVQQNYDRSTAASEGAVVIFGTLPQPCRKAGKA
jgi:hypothetical protein